MVVLSVFEYILVHVSYIVYCINRMFVGILMRPYRYQPLIMV